MSRTATVLLCALAAGLSPAVPAYAHALQPGYLQLSSTGPDLYAVLWKTPGVGGRPMAITARLPQACDPREPGSPTWNGSAYVSRFTARCPGGLTEGTLAIRGLNRTTTDVLVRIEHADGGSETLRLTPDQPEAVLVGRRSAAQIAGTYVRLGVEHILGGIDHLLFVAALLLLVSGWRRLLGVVTAFTVAHSITLTASTLGVIAVPAAPIEALIALSTVFVAAEFVHLRQGRTSITRDRPWVMAFAFGLLHGVGFASALGELGLPPEAIPAALLFFNLGVEVGQLIFVGSVLALGWAFRTMWADSAWPNPRAVRYVASYGIGVVAAFWTLERVVANWT